MGPGYLKGWSGATPPAELQPNDAVPSISYRAARAFCGAKGADLPRMDATPQVRDEFLEWRLGPNADRPALLGDGQRMNGGVPGLVTGSVFRCAR